MKQSLIILAALCIFLFSQCKKETEDFVYCGQCSIEEWKGNFVGNGTHFKSSTGTTTEDVEVVVNINITSESKLSINVLSPNLLSENFFGSKENDEHYIQFAGSSKSLDLSLYKKGEEYKITGTVKILKSPGSDGSSIDETLTFRVFKKLQ